MICEKCWSDACLQAKLHGGLSIHDRYLFLLKGREVHPCSPEEQRGERKHEAGYEEPIT